MSESQPQPQRLKRPRWSPDTTRKLFSLPPPPLIGHDTPIRYDIGHVVVPWYKICQDILFGEAINGRTLTNEELREVYNLPWNLNLVPLGENRREGGQITQKIHLSHLKYLIRRFTSLICILNQLNEFEPTDFEALLELIKLMKTRIRWIKRYGSGIDIKNAIDFVQSSNLPSSYKIILINLLDELENKKAA